MDFTCKYSAEFAFQCSFKLLFYFSDKEYFPDPYRYNPDRWSKENRDSIPKYAFLGFGEGPRICLGILKIYIILL